MHDSERSGSVDGRTRRGSHKRRASPLATRSSAFDRHRRATAPGTYIGSSNIEGFQGADVHHMMMDNRAQRLAREASQPWMARRLGGFTSIVRRARLQLRRRSCAGFPAKVAVTETDGGDFPIPSYSLSSPDSQALDLTGSIDGVFRSLFALTDRNNHGVGGAADQPKCTSTAIRSRKTTGPPTASRRCMTARSR